MANRKISASTAILGTAVDAAADYLMVLDVSDTTDAATGTNKKMLASGLIAAAGLTATATELNFVDGVTSPLQTQIDGKQASGSYLTSANIVETITNGVTTKSPSENAVFDALALKQDVLVSGTNIKTINSTSLLGSGDIAISSGLTIGTTAITGSTATRLLKVNSDNTVGEYTITGSGTVVAMATSPTFVTSIVTPKIIGGTGTTSTLTFQTTSGVGATGADIIFNVGNNGATEAMRILNNGNVGIGTAAPSELLQLLNAGAAEKVVNIAFGVYGVLGQTDDTVLDKGIVLGNNVKGGVGGYKYLYTTELYGYRAVTLDKDGISIIANSGATTAGAAIASAERIRILNNGNVGIGTTTPLSTLHIGVAPTAVTTYGLVSLGDGGFAGGAGHFSGSANGTLLAGCITGSADLINMGINISSTYTPRFKVYNSGGVNLPSLPTSRPSVVGDLYIDTAANILANGDKLVGIRI